MKNVRKPRIYEPNSPDYFRISRSKIELFIQCPRCFYLDLRRGVRRLRGLPFNLNSAVDSLLKSEFDSYRSRGEQHPDLERFGIPARPASHPELDIWRDSFRGIDYRVPEINIEIFGGIDDLWIDEEGRYVIVDYKSTSRRTPITVLDKPYHATYRRQLDIYAWLLEKNGYSASPKAYWYYCNGDAAAPVFEHRILFDVTIIPYDVDLTWIDNKIAELYAVLQKDEIPRAGPTCEYCAYCESISEEISPKNKKRN